MNSKDASGISFATVLFLIFLVLKLTDHINWSWWWVFSPLWIPILIAVSFVAIVFTISMWENKYGSK